MRLKQAALATLIATIGMTLFTGQFLLQFFGMAAGMSAGLTAVALLRQYPAGAVAPFALLAPCVGSAISVIAVGERFGAWQLFGMGLLLTGVAAVAMSRNSSRKNCGRTFNLARHQVFNVGDVSGCAISTVSGELWITLGGPRDFLLPVGESMCIKRPDEVVVNAVQDSMFKIHAIQ